MRTHYAGHDKEYQRRKEAGQSGWNDAGSVEENIARLAAALRASHMPQNGRVLELGCGAGDLTLWLAAQGYEADGVDIAPTAIAWAQSKAQQCGLSAQFQVGDVTTLAGYEGGSYGLVIDGYCLHCIIGADRAAFWSSAHRVLAPGGVLHICTMCGDPVTDACRQNYDPVSRCQIYGGIATRYYGRASDIQAEAAAAGFEIITAAVERPADGVGQDMLLLDVRKAQA